MNLDDKSLFLDAMEDVQPLKRATDVHWHPTRNQRAPQNGVQFYSTSPGGWFA